MNYQNQIKIINFFNLLNFQPSPFFKRMYIHAEYFSPEQIELSNDLQMQ